MRKITFTPAKSALVGELPQGCRLCISGEKLVLFVSGLCPRNCFYCTLSDKRKNADKSWANEQLIESDEDLLKEAKLCQARGAGITGGEPLLRKNIGKTLHCIALLKKNFGKDFHIHLYTSGIGMSDAVLQQLEDAGLDEIRFHLDINNEANWKILLPALKHKFNVGVEIPCIPGTFGKLKKLALWLDAEGAKFLNLNEFELSELQYEEMQKRGFILASGGIRQVKGSRELAQKLLSFAAKNPVAHSARSQLFRACLEKLSNRSWKDLRAPSVPQNCKMLSVHFCPTMLKDVYQYTNRIRRRAESIKKPFETVTKEGLLKKGVIFADIWELVFLPKNELFWRRELKRTETSPENAKIAAKKGFKAAIVLELPTADGFDVETEPL